MFDIYIILLIAFSVLLVIQIIALFKIRKLIFNLKKNVIDLSLNRSLSPGSIKEFNIQICQFCRYRQTYINAVPDGSDDFYYRCRIHNSSTKLNQSCKNFAIDPY